MSLVFKDPKTGISQPIRFVKATAYDADGNEIKAPKCEKCGSDKNQIIGKDKSIYICNGCGL